MNNKPDFTLSEQWQNTIAAIIALIAIIAIAAIARQASTPTATPTPETTAIAEATRPTAPPTFTATPTPTSTAPTATPTPTATASPTPKPTATFTPTPIVVGWRELGNLTSLEYTLQTVVEVSHPAEGFFGGLLGEDHVLMSVVGNVEAGIDMSKIEASDVSIDRTRVKVILPPATISSVEILPDQSEIFDSKHKWAFSEYDGMETEALNTARHQLENWATNEANILPLAEKLASLQLRAFLETLGFTDIEITFNRSQNATTIP